MKKFTLVLLVCFSHSLLKAQTQKGELIAFENLMDGTWVSEGLQLGGHQGKTTFIYEWGLDGNMVKVKTFTTDPKTFEYGVRNEGVRCWDATNKQVVFYEFDKQGGITQGTVTLEGQNIFYDYSYHGTQLRDAWIYIDRDTYRYIVGVWQEGEWLTKYHETKFVRVVG